MKDTIFLQGIENEDYLSIGHGKNLKIIIFDLLLIFFSKYEKSFESEVCFVDYPKAKSFFSDFNEKQMLYHASALNSLKKIRNNRSAVSPFKFGERIKILIEAIKIYKESKYNQLFGYFLDYSIIEHYMINQKCKRVITCETINRCALWLGELQHKINGELEIIPHGTMISTKKIDLPNKFWIDRIHVWNEVEKNIYQNGVCKNKECEYVFNKYKPSVLFEKYGDDKRIKIGVFTQMDCSRYLEVINDNRIEENKYLFIIMPHPLEPPFKAENRPNITVIKGQKFIDLDAVLTGNSTMIYDLVYSGYKGKIIVFSNVTPYASLSSKIVFADSRDSLVKELLKCEKSMVL